MVDSKPTKISFIDVTLVTLFGLALFILVLAITSYIVYQPSTNNIDEKSCQVCLQKYNPDIALKDSIPYYRYLNTSSFMNYQPMIMMRDKILQDCSEECNSTTKIGA